MTKNHSQSEYGNTAVDVRDAEKPQPGLRKSALGEHSSGSRNARPQHSDAESSPAHGSPAAAARRPRLKKKRVTWRCNFRLFGVSAAVIAVLLTASSASYFYHSKATVQTLLKLAETARSKGNFDEQAKWLRRYSLLNPENRDAIYEMAIAADLAADRVPKERLGDAIDQARKVISNAIAQLGADSTKIDDPVNSRLTPSAQDQTTERIVDLRRRLIKRLGQLGGVWNREAERQVAELKAAHGDPESLSALARSLLGQLNDASYQERQAERVSQSDDYWRWLANQPVGYVLGEAMAANPASVELASNFLLASQQHPTQFAPVQEHASLSETRLAELTLQSVKTLQADSSSRAKLTLYQYLGNAGKEEEATEVIVAAAVAAQESLGQYAKFRPGIKGSSSPPSPAEVASRKSSSAESSSEEFASVEPPAAYWDYLLVSEWARRQAAIDAGRSRSLYGLLIRVDHPSIPSPQVERVYLESARLQLAGGAPDEAIRLYREGLDRVDGDRLPLLRSLAQVQFSQGQLTAARHTTERLSTAIETARRRLARVSEQEMDRSQRVALGRQLEAENWYLTTLQGFLAARQKRDSDAILLLQQAVGSKADVSNDDRVRASMQLAQVLGAEGVWDQSSAVLDQAVQLAPSHRELRLMAADVATRAGNRLRAMEHWRAIQDLSDDQDPQLKVQVLQARFNDQILRVPEQRDFDSIRSDLDQLIQQLAEPNGAGDPDQQRQAVASSAALLRLMIPPADVAAETHLQSQAFADSVEKLAAQAETTAPVLAYAAERLAQAKLPERSSTILQRFKALEEVDELTKSLVEARVLSALGDPAAAAKLLNEQADRMASASESAGGVTTADTAGETTGDTAGESTGETTGDAGNDTTTDRAGSDLVALQINSMRMAASEFARRGGDIELAYRSVAQLTVAQQTLASLFVTAELAQALPSNSSLLKRGAKTLTSDELASQWTSQLRQREGDSGANWRFLEAMRLVGRINENRFQIERSDPRISQARQQISRVLAIRPLWGEAISLEGYLSAFEGQAEKSIEQLRRGIAAGDQRMTTRRLLWEQLIAQGRLEEAEREIQLASLGSPVSLDLTTVAKIDVAMRQGDHEKSLAMAQQAAAASPANALPHLVVAATATAAFRSTTDESRRDAFRKQAESGIAAARRIGGDQDARVVSAGLRLALARDEPAAIEDSIFEIQNSQIDELAKNQLLAEAFIAIKKFDEALSHLLRVDEIASNANSQLLLSDLYRLIKQPEKELAALRLAQKRDPSNSRLRNLLAQKLVAASALGGILDWDELASLLSDDDLVRGENRLLHAVFLGSDSVKTLASDPASQAAWQRMDNAQAILRELILNKASNADGARRLLALFLQEQRRINDQRAQSKLVDSEIRTLHESLCSRAASQPTDVYRYAGYLLNQNDDQDDRKIIKLLERLQSDASGSLPCLEIGIRVAYRAGDADKSPEIVSQWVSTALGSLRADSEMANQSAAVFTAAGSSLLQLGFFNESTPWFKQAYEKQPSMLANYVLALGKAKELDEALHVCTQHFAQHQDPVSATLFLEVLLSVDDLKEQSRVASENEALIDTALGQHVENEALLESVGTIRMTQNRFADAVKLFQRALKKQPTRIRSLNNLAMSLAEIPGRAAEGIAPINAALELTNQNAEILDTKGVVLLAAGRADQAEATFKKAFAASNDSRHQFHVTVSQLEQNKEQDAKKSWQQLDLQSLDPRGLTIREREQLEILKKKYTP